MTDREIYLQSLQGAINRLSGQSFTIKGWALTVFSAFLGLAVSQHSTPIAMVALVPTVLFWTLDGYYLALERRFRQLFENAFRNTSTVIDEMHFDHKNEQQSHGLANAITSAPILYFYLCITTADLIASLLMRTSK